MTNFIFNIIISTFGLANLYAIFIFTFSVIFIHYSNKKVFGLTFKKFTNYDSFTEGVLVLFLVIFIANFIFETIYHFISFLINKFELTEFINYMSNTPANNTPANNTPTYNYPVQDPVRYWPSSTVTIPAAFLTAYRVTAGTPRQRLGAGLAAVGVVAPAVFFNAAIENPNGFKMLFHGYSVYRRTGTWPDLVHPTTTNQNPNQNPNLNSNQNPNSQNNPVNNVSSNNDSVSGTNNFWGGNSDNDSYFNIIYDQLNDIINTYLLKPFLTLIKPVEVTGHLDDLLGQQLFILLLMLVVVISLFILMLIYFSINILLHNKERILNITNNKYLIFYTKYQLFLGKLSLFVFPCLIFTGLFILFSGLLFIITHQIPFEDLGIDLHTFIQDY